MLGADPLPLEHVLVTTTTPEPAAMVFLASGLVLLLFVRRLRIA